MLPSRVAEAASVGNLEAVKAWLAQPTADIDAQDGRGWTLLHHTCRGASTAVHAALAEYLLSRGADVNRESRGTRIPLFLAVARHERSQADMVGLLLRAGSEVNARAYDRCETPLAWAVGRWGFNGNASRDARALECVVKLLRAGASLDSIGKFHVVGKSKSIEDYMARQSGQDGYPNLNSSEHFIACQGMVKELRAAGSWRKYVIVPMKEVLRLRSLIARGRAREVRRLRARTPRPIAWLMSPRVPNEIAWRVLGYWNPRC